MSKMLKNTTASPIAISDVGGTILPAAPATYTINPKLYSLWAASSNILTYLNDTAGAGGGPSVIVNDGSVDLSPNAGAHLLLGIWPEELVYNPTPKIFITDPTPNTETLLALPSGTKKYRIVNRGIYKLKLAFVLNGTTGDCLTLYPNAPYPENEIGVAALTLYFSSAGASQPVEVLSWT